MLTSENHEVFQPKFMVIASFGCGTATSQFSKTGSKPPIADGELSIG